MMLLNISVSLRLPHVFSETMITWQNALWLPNVGVEFVLGKNDVPEPGPGEVLVQLKASALNPIDWKIRRAGFVHVKEYPAIIGQDGAGVVQKVGDDVTNLSLGDKVFFQASFGNKYAAFQEYCLADAALATKIPPNLSFEQAASIAHALAPFAVAMYAQHPKGLGLVPPFEEIGLGKYANQPIVIMGGSASLGQYAIQLAKLSGFSPIIVTASPHNTDTLLSLGATHVVDRSLSVGALREHFASVQIHYAFDAISSAETQRAALLRLGVRGQDKLVFMVVGDSHAPENRALFTGFSAALTQWLAEGVVKPNKVEVLPGGLKGIVPGLRRLEANNVSGSKFVIRPGETTDY